MSPEEKKIGLSIRAVGEEASRQEVEQYKKKPEKEKGSRESSPASSSSSSSSTTTLGEMIKWKQEEK
jgi:small subunit ribosomal protein S1